VSRDASAASLAPDARVARAAATGPDDRTRPGVRRVGIVLAGGRSTRFGRDKLAEPFGDRPLIGHPIAAVGAVADLVIVAGPHEPGAALGTLTAGGAASWTSRPVIVTADGEPNGGPLVGLRTALGVATEAGALEAIVVGGDMPWLRSAVLERMLDLLERGPCGRAADAAVALEGGSWRPLPIALGVTAATVAVDTHLASGARDLFGMLRRLDLATLPEAAWRPLDPAGVTFRDVDRPADLDPRQG
jgi:molybdopterin-guanine dinucleotide biosynthesis protein A